MRGKPKNNIILIIIIIIAVVIFYLYCIVFVINIMFFASGVEKPKFHLEYESINQLDDLSEVYNEITEILLNEQAIDVCNFYTNLVIIRGKGNNISEVGFAIRTEDRDTFFEIKVFNDKFEFNSYKTVGSLVMKVTAKTIFEILDETDISSYLEFDSDNEYEVVINLLRFSLVRNDIQQNRNLFFTSRKIDSFSDDELLLVASSVLGNHNIIAIIPLN